MKKFPMELYAGLTMLTVFRSLAEEPIMQNLKKLFAACGSLTAGRSEEAISAYCAFASSLYALSARADGEVDADLSACLLRLIVNDENFYLKARAQKKAVSPLIEAQVREELSYFQRLSALEPAHFAQQFQAAGFGDALPGWKTSRINFAEEYHRRIEALPQTGYGIFADYHAFTYTRSAVVPVKRPDMQQLSQLSGYERERSQVLRNTELFLDGGTASNILLYGDAGTGKSSAVKAVANHLKDRGLRLVEVKKNQLYQIPDLLEELAANPLKFLLFIDDLSFSSNDDNFSALKAILEGGVSACGENVLIYATSNRRHLVKETMSERSGDELYLNDTLQETMSLSARFGLTITFQKPDKDAYLSIVRHLAAEYKLPLPEEELFRRAEAFAIRSNGRSPRTAKHFIELQKAGL